MVYITSKAGIALLLCLCAAPLVALLALAWSVYVQ